MNQKQKMKQPEGLAPSGRIALLRDIIRVNRLRVILSSVGLILVALLDGISILSLFPQMAIAMGHKSVDQTGTKVA